MSGATQPSPQVKNEARRLIQVLTDSRRPHGSFDASRYFRSTEQLSFLNVGTATVREHARALAKAHRGDWTIVDALGFADVLMRDRHLEIKGAGLEVLRCFGRALLPRHLAVMKGWLAADRSANWATTDLLSCGLIAPLLVEHPELVARVGAWSHHRNMWVRRASAVSLVLLARRGVALDAAYATATALSADPADLIQKAVGWLLREAGKTDGARLERYLIEHGPAMARTSVRYAIERFTPDARTRLLRVTRREPSPPRAAQQRVRVTRGRPTPTFRSPKSSSSKRRAFR